MGELLAAEGTKDSNDAGVNNASGGIAGTSGATTNQTKKNKKKAKKKAKAE